MFYFNEVDVNKSEWDKNFVLKNYYTKKYKIQIYIKCKNVDHIFQNQQNNMCTLCCI